MATIDRIIAIIPLLIPLYYLIPLLFVNENDNPILTIKRWITMVMSSAANDKDDNGSGDEQQVFQPPPVSSQLLAYIIVALFGYIATSKLVPNIKVRYIRSCRRRHRLSLPLSPSYWDV